MNSFDKGRPIELVARVKGSTTENISVVIESLMSDREEVEVQLRLFEQSKSGEFRLNLPTANLPRGEYDLTISAVAGQVSSTLVKDHFVLN